MLSFKTDQITFVGKVIVSLWVICVIFRHQNSENNFSSNYSHTEPLKNIDANSYYHTYDA